MKYAWRRFWCPRDGLLDLSDNGFLVDPEEAHGLFCFSEAKVFEEIDEVPCLALLGEPGMGKSTFLEELNEKLEIELKTSDDEYIFINLDDFGNENRVIEELFLDDAILKWKKGKHKLTIVLDGLDECKLKIPKIGTLIKNQLKKLEKDVSRLKIRIASRTADWPSSLEKGFRELWGENFSAFELAPLRKRDVRIAAEVEKLDSDLFIKKLVDSRSVPFAIKPVTLNFLVSSFKTGEFPKTLEELYLIGCKNLLVEKNENRRDLIEMNEIEITPLEEKFLLASRIAALTIFCKKSSILYKEGLISDGLEALTFDEILAGSEVLNGKTFDFKAKQIREVLNTGLFSARGPDTLGFAHQTYAEYLASQYIKKHLLSSEKTLRLLTCFSENSDEIVPNLYELTSWLCSNDENLFYEIVKTKPHVVIRGDPNNWSDTQKQEIVKYLIEGIEQGSIDRQIVYHIDNFYKLKNPAIINQLLLWIKDKAAKKSAREVAIHIAGYCRLKEIGEQIVDIVLDETESCSVRREATIAVKEIADKEISKKLLSLVQDELDFDEDDEIKGYALESLCPEIIPTRKIFNFISSPKRTSFWGSYKSFLFYKLPNLLDESSILNGLIWVRQNLELDIKRGHNTFVRELSDKIIRRSFSFIDFHEVAEELVLCFIELSKKQVSFVKPPFGSDEKDPLESTEMRREFIELVLKFPINESSYFALIHEYPQFFRRSDLNWGIEKLKRSLNTKFEEKWAELVWRLFRITPVKSPEISLFVEARKNSAELDAKSNDMFEPVELASEEAQNSKQEYLELQKYQEERENRKIDYNPVKHINSFLARMNNGDIDCWFLICRELSLEEGDRYFNEGLIFTKEITALPSWHKIDKYLKNEILEAAILFIESCPQLSVVNNFRQISGGEIAGFRALRLVREYSETRLLELSTRVLVHWLPVMFYFIDTARDETIPLLKIVKTKAPEAFFKAQALKISKELERQEVYISDSLLNSFWSDELSLFLYNKLDEKEIKPSVWLTLIQALMSHQFDKAFETANRKLKIEPEKEASKREIQIASALALLNSVNASFYWNDIWHIIISNNDFGKELMEKLASDFGRESSGFCSNLNFTEAADLFIWLLRNYPYETDPKHDGVYTPTSNDHVRDLRNKVLRYIENSGHQDSYIAIERIVKEFPEYPFLKNSLIRSKEYILKNNCKPLSPTEFLSFINNERAVVVKNASDLQNLIISCLDKIQVYLHGESTPIEDLWNRVPLDKQRHTYQPKTEDQLSHWIKRQLEYLLKDYPILVAREVEIRPKLDAQKGQETDLYISMKIPTLSGELEKIWVIVETKGCWNNGLKTNMKSQLLDRYLFQNQTKHGIYLIGWFLCDAWDDNHYQKKDTPKMKISEVRAFFEKQAESLSQDGVKICSFVLDTRYGNCSD